MSNDENKFQPIFQILHIKSAWFLLELTMALVTTIAHWNEIFAGVLLFLVVLKVKKSQKQFYWLQISQKANEIL